MKASLVSVTEVSSLHVVVAVVSGEDMVGNA